LVTALADFYKRQIEIENQTTNHLATLSQAQEKKYTVDGIHFYNTQAELNAAIEAERRKKQTVYVRPMSIKKQQSADVQDLHDAIEKRLQLEVEKEEGNLSFTLEREFCCEKHRGVFDAHIEEMIRHEAVDYDHDFNLVSGVIAIWLLIESLSNRTLIDTMPSVYLW